jgi:hypothetical protein
MKYSVTFLPLLAALAVASPVLSARQEIDAPDFSVSSIIYGGSGCPEDRKYGISSTVKSTGASSYLTINVKTDDYVARAGPNVDIIDSRKNCQVGIGLQYPGGMQYAITSTRSSGHVALDSGVSALQKSIYYFQAGTSQVSTEEAFSGACKKDYVVDGSVPVVWSPCGSASTVNVNSQVRVDNGSGGASGVITGSVGGIVKFELGLKWRKC